MRNLFLTTAAAILSAVVAGAAPVPAPATANAPFAVIELFTSEGCSSCPPADELLKRTVEEAKQKGQRVFAIELHVDYWNHLGWSDPFSSADFSDRQTDYAAAFKLQSIYTPQMIVNGTTQFVGSQAAPLAKALATALQTPASSSVALTTEKTADPKTIRVKYHVQGLPRDVNSVLHVVATEEGLTTDVKRGENGGRQLQHTNVARGWSTVGLTSEGPGEGSIEVKLQEGVIQKNLTLIAFLQDPKTSRILGAASAPAPSGK